MKATYADVENRPSQQGLSQNARTRNKILARNDSLARIPLILQQGLIDFVPTPFNVFCFFWFCT
jgi:hypothetical protein